MEQWKRNLKDLLSGPFAGYGGVTQLAQELEVSRQTVYQWQTDRRAPDVSNRLGLRFLVKKYAGPWSG